MPLIQEKLKQVDTLINQVSGLHRYIHQYNQLIGIRGTFQHHLSWLNPTKPQPRQRFAKGSGMPATAGAARLRVHGGQGSGARGARALRGGRV